MFNKREALRAIEEVQRWNGPESQAGTFALIALETIRRWAPRGSAYVKRAEAEFGSEEQGYELMRILEALKWQLEHDRGDLAPEVHTDLLAQDPRSVALRGAVDGIRTERPLRLSQVKAFMSEIGLALAPDPRTRGTDYSARFAVSLPTTVGLLDDFGTLAEALGFADDPEASAVLFKGFEHVLTQYFSPSGGSPNVPGFELARVVGWELFTTFISTLIRHERWATLNRLLSEKLYVPNPPGSSNGPKLIGWQWLWSDARAVNHPYVLKERHERGAPPGRTGWADIVAADFFLALRSPVIASEYWWPGTLHDVARQFPRFLIEASTPSGAQSLARGLGISKPHDLRARIEATLDALLRETKFPDTGAVKDIQSLVKQHLWPDGQFLGWDLW